MSSRKHNTLEKDAVSFSFPSPSFPAKFFLAASTTALIFLNFALGVLCAETSISETVLDEIFGHAPDLEALAFHTACIKRSCLIWSQDICASVSVLPFLASSVPTVSKQRCCFILLFDFKSFEPGMQKRNLEF